MDRDGYFVVRGSFFGPTDEQDTGSGIEVGDALLLESGDVLLLESGDQVLLEA